MKIIDHLLREFDVFDPFTGIRAKLPNDLREGLRKKFIKVDCTNVAEYLYRGTEQENWNINKDFPNLAPPFESMWLEWVMPRMSNSNGKMIETDAGKMFSRIAVAIHSSTNPKEFTASRGESVKVGQENFKRFKSVTESGNAKWEMVCSAIFQFHHGGIIVCPIHRIMLIQESGEFLDMMHATVGVSARSIEEQESAGNEFWSQINPAWLAISFMHCKNVSFQTERISLPLQKNAMKKHGVPLAVFKTLDIAPLKVILKSTNIEGGSHDLKRALHIARGHFKDYRQSGLFGKVKGIFWWDLTVRGNKEHGTVEKDYTVKIPI